MTHTKLPCLILALLGAVLARAAVPDKLPPLAFDHGRGAFEIIERLRYEDRADTFDFDHATPSATDGSWLVQRVRVGLNWRPDPSWSLQIQLQDAREFGSDRPKVPFILGAEGNDPLDLRLASVTWGDPKTSPIQFTLGRQTLVLGDERLVGIGEWNNFARTFDAAKLVWNDAATKTTWTAFVSSVVTVNPTTSGESWRIDESHFDNDFFAGLHAARKLTPLDSVEAYVLWRDKRDNTPIYTAPTAAIPAPARSAAAYDIDQNIYTLGARFLRAPKPGAFDLELEAAWQGGHVDRQTTAATGNYAGNRPKLQQDAWAIHSLLGYTPEGAPGKLRFDIEYNVATGDAHRSDGRNASFMSLFPSNHKWYGFMDAFAWKNMEEWVATIRFNPLPKTTFRVDWHNFALFTTADAWYRANGVATVRPLSVAAQHAPRDAGSEIDLTLTWTPVNWAGFDVGWSRFNAGNYLKATGAHSNATFFYAQTGLKF